MEIEDFFSGVPDIFLVGRTPRANKPPHSDISMKTKIRNKLFSLARKLQSQNRDIQKYVIETERKPFQSTPKEVQLSSYFRYSVNIERRL